jgi:hypothetical protein
LFVAVAAAFLAVGWSLVQTVRGVSSIRFPSGLRDDIGRWQLQAGTVFLHPLQQIARLKGRLSLGLTPWRRRRLALSIPSCRTLWLASGEWQDSIERLRLLETALRANGSIVRRGGCFDNWDLEARSGTLASMRILMAEEFSRDKQLVRVRVWPKLSRPCVLAVMLLAALSIAAAYDQARSAAIVLCVIAGVLGTFLFEDCAGTACIVERLLIQQGFAGRNTR